MARVNVYLPDDLADEARAAGLNVSNVLQRALRQELVGERTSRWLRGLGGLPVSGVDHAEALAALDAVRTEAGDDWPRG